ncbi:MAG: 50S ribosomal protein L10 [Asgard group archaeon]|nr:50S ribosomal protein L10 [Asgard group archaeon]
MSSKISAYQHEPNPMKKKQLVELVHLIQQYKNVGITRVENIASKTIQKIRHDLRGEATFKVAKNTIIKLAIQELAKKDKNLSKLLDYINGSCALVLTNDNPFKIANFLEKNKIPTAAKEGQIAPKNITVKARDTGFAPGPVIGELQSIGLNTRIEGGTIKIVDDAIVCKAGEKVSKTLANVLGRLGEEPFDAGLSIDVIYDGSSLIGHENLIIDYEEIMSNLTKAYQDAYALSIEIAYPTKQNISQLIGKARREALSLAVETNFITPETAGNILAKTQLEAIILAKLIATKDPSLIPADLLAASQATTTTTTTTETKPKEEAKKEETEAEEEDSGLGSLFG